MIAELNLMSNGISAQSYLVSFENLSVIYQVKCSFLFQNYDPIGFNIRRRFICKAAN